MDSSDQSLLELERDLREALRDGYVRVVLDRLSDRPCKCSHRTPNGARCRACGLVIYLDGGAALETPSEAMADAAEMLWVVLANVSGGDWTQQSLEWQEAAARYRDKYFAAMGYNLSAASLASRTEDQSN